MLVSLSRQIQLALQELNLELPHQVYDF